MIEFVVAVLGGFAAHQADRVVVNFPREWEYITRYIVGGLTVILFFALFLVRLNRSAWRDGMLAIIGAFGGVGLGVSLARLYFALLAEVNK